MSFRSMGSHSSKGERLMEILHQTCCLQDYSLALGFQVRKTGLSVWEKYSVKTRAVASWKSTFLRPFTWQIQGKLSFNRGKQLFILGTFFFFLKCFHRWYRNRITQDRPLVLSNVTATPCGLHWLPVEMLLLLIATEKLHSSCYWKHIYPAF